MTLDDQLRIIAKSSYWQSIYDASLKCANIQLFNNINNYSGLQTRFIYWLSVYKMLYEELSTYEDDRLTIDVINDIDRTDAYLMYRSKKNEFEWKQYRQDEKQSKLKSGKKQWKNPGKETICNIDFRRE